MIFFDENNFKKEQDQIDYTNANKAKKMINPLNCDVRMCKSWVC